MTNEELRFKEVVLAAYEKIQKLEEGIAYAATAEDEEERNNCVDELEKLI